MSGLTRVRFYLALYSNYFGLARGGFAEVPDGGVERTAHPHRKRVHFWTPTLNAGAKVIVHDVLPGLQQAAREMQLDWEITADTTVPPCPLDVLVCFKAVPSAEQARQCGRKVLLICDQPEVFWDDIRKFDAVVATSSRCFAQLLAWEHQRVSFLSESEPMHYLSFGEQNLATSPLKRGNVLLWHGGRYSQDALNLIRPILSQWRSAAGAQLHIVSGSAPQSTERWGALEVVRMPWSEKQMFQSAAVARLGIVPARRSVRNSWLKPASRLRCLYALGVAAIGDSRVPDVMEFTQGFGGPVAASPEQWIHRLDSLWENETALATLAKQGHQVVANGFGTDRTARQWIHYLAHLG